MKKISYITLVVFTLFTVICIDQVSKFFAMSYLFDMQVTSFFSLTLSLNRGISFGMLNNASQEQIFLILMAIGISCFIFYLMITMQSKTKLKILSLTLIVSGAIGNIIDRIRVSAVIDFIHLHYSTYHFPIFNVADMAICCGCILFMYCENTHKLKKTTR